MRPKTCELCGGFFRIECKRHAIPHEIYEGGDNEGNALADLGDKLAELECNADEAKARGDVMGASFQRNALALYRAFIEYGTEVAS